MTKIFLLILGFATIAAACSHIASKQVSNKVLKIGDKSVEVEVVDNVFSRAKGLGGRTSLGTNNGMLFLFYTPGKYTFWMKDTLIPLDFIWIKDGKVTEITANAPIEPGATNSSLLRYTPTEPVDSVLEVNAGWSAANQIKVGDSAVVDQN